jgi:hypothetical protein
VYELLGRDLWGFTTRFVEFLLQKLRGRDLLLFFEFLLYELLGRDVF